MGVEDKVSGDATRLLYAKQQMHSAGRSHGKLSPRDLLAWLGSERASNRWAGRQLGVG